jgi:uncharacterized protein HemY
MHAAMLSREPQAIASAASWTPWDPVAANLAAAGYANFDGSEPALREAVHWLERAHQRQPDWPFYLNKIAQLRLLLGDNEEARSALDEAQKLQPWNVQSLDLVYALAYRTNDQSLLDETRDRLCTLGPDFCPDEFELG